MYRLMFAAVVTGLVFVAGCKHKCCLNDPGRRPQPYLPQAPNTPFLLPPAGVPTTPAPGGGAVVPPVGPADLRNYQPPPAAGKPAPEVLLPDPIPGAPAPSNSGSGFLGGPVNPQTTEPPASQKKSDSPPVNLPGYARVKEGIASGRKPSLDGFDALKQAGFRTVIYLHPAGADVAAVKDVAAKRGLAFVALEATPEKLPEVIEQFNAVTADKSRHTIYVFDDDGVRTGAIWYLHFRTAEAMNDDAARVRARPLGLTDQGEEAKAFAIATQRYLESR